MSYYGKLTEAMNMLASEPNTIFIGQSVAYPGQAMHQSLAQVPMERRLEFPVAEDFQMGYSIGLALTGKLPITIYPRFDFLILALNQLVNHLDKAAELGWPPCKVIIRTAVGSKRPVDAGPQHTQDHTRALSLMLQSVRVYNLGKADEIIPAYIHALEKPESCLMIEHAEGYYNG